MRTFFMLSTVVLSLMLPLGAQGTRTRIDVSKLGPQVGERIPDFTLPDQNGQAQTLQSVMGPRGAMIVFVRSADW